MLEPIHRFRVARQRREEAGVVEAVRVEAEPLPRALLQPRVEAVSEA